MILCKITDLKDFMGKLLNTDCFDSFLLGEAILHTGNSFVIDGHVNFDFYTEEERQDPQIVPYDFVEWKASRSVCFELIKGKRTPTSFQFVFYLKPEAMKQVLEHAGYSDAVVRQMVLNIKYDSNGLTLTTGIAYHVFTMDKQPDTLWDNAARKFLLKKEISFEELS